MICPHCKSDLEGGLIWETFNNLHGPEKADEYAEMYGATRETGRWGREIGLEYGRDRVEEFMCPDCRWKW